MSGSVFGDNFRITTWGESHGPALGVVIDGVPAGLKLDESDIQPYLNRRKPGQSRFTTARGEGDEVTILSGTFNGITTGTPVSMIVYNKDQHSKDYSDIADKFRPGHADYGFCTKYGLRDYRGGGRSSGRETIARVAAGAVAAKLLKELGIEVSAYASEIGSVSINEYKPEDIYENPFYMADNTAAEEAARLAEEAIKNNDSMGGVIECRITGVPAGIGEPVFNKLDAVLSHAIMSIGAVKGVEIGDGFAAARTYGSENNDEFTVSDGKITKKTNHAGGILGGISDGSEIILRAAVKPTPSIARDQSTVNEAGEETVINIKGRHDPLVVPRAVVVVECMAAVAVYDLLISNMSARLENIKKVYDK